MFNQNKHRSRTNANSSQQGSKEGGRPGEPQSATPHPATDSPVAAGTQTSGTYRATQPTLIDTDRPSLNAPSTEKNRFLLTVLTGPAKGTVIQLDSRVLTLGRSEEADIALPDPSLSRLHARLITDAEGQVFIEDSGSTNGTYVGDEPIRRPTPLTDGVRVGLGKRTLARFSVQDALEERAVISMHESALRDKLTKAYNRNVFDDRIEGEMAFSRRHSRPLALLLLDIDHFKSVNDTHGHTAGDWVLAKVAEQIHGTLRVEDVFARYGGEEFAVLLRDSYPTDAAITAERLRALIEGTSMSFQGQTLRVTVSIGIASTLSGLKESLELVQAADSALYEAKAQGRNRIEVHGIRDQPHLRQA